MAQKMALREYIDSLRSEGYTVHGSEEEDPILLAPDGSAVETWREDYPYSHLIDTSQYEEEKYRLQVEPSSSSTGARTPTRSTCSSSRAAMPPVREARSSASWSTSTHVPRASSL